MTKKLTNYEFNKRVRDMCGGTYEFVDNYVNMKTKIRVKHKVCNKTYSVTPNNFMRGKRCPYCSHRVSPNEFYKKFNDRGLIGKSLETPYYDVDTPIIVYCSIHNSRKELSPTAINRGKFLCDYCRSEYNHLVQMKTSDEFKQSILDVHSGKLSVIGKYFNTHTKILINCNVCSTRFLAEPNSLLSAKSGCPRCARSFSENELQKILREHSINFEQQKKFSECKYKKPLPFDFYIEEYNLLIELDGEQHYKPIDYFGGEKSFRSQVLRDHIKNSFCYRNGIKLVRVIVDSNRNKTVNKLNKLVTMIERNGVCLKPNFKTVI